MPTRTDITVINQTYSTNGYGGTSGNGGRKLVMLDNGWLVTAVHDSSGTNRIRLFVSKDNGVTFTQLCEMSHSYVIYDFTIVNKGTMVYVLLLAKNTLLFNKFDALTVPNEDIKRSNITLDSTVTDGRNTSMIINPQGTEIHAAWSVKNSTYVSSFNIRYAKGVINADGSVAWRTAEQVTKVDTAFFDFTSPSILVDDKGIVSIVSDVGGGNVLLDTGYTGTVDYAITIFKRDLSLQNNQYVSTAWSYKNIYLGGSNTQSSPSAIFVPNVINGLPQGRIWVTWHGADGGDITQQIRLSYSDDGGVTWSSMEKVTTDTTGSKYVPTITANKKNKIFILYNKKYGANNNDVEMLESTDGVTWSQSVIKNSNVRGTSPNALVNYSVDMPQPLFVYTGQTSVGFFGKWITTDISPKTGNIGNLASKDGLLTYTITSDEMSTITEKLNGVVINTRVNPTSGKSYVVNLSAEQWQTVTVGATAILSIEMGSEIFTYDFRKLLNGDSSIIEVVQGVQAIGDYLTEVKTDLVAKVGGDVTDSFDTIIANAVLGKKWASGTTSSGSQIETITGLGFKPSIIIAKGTYWTNTGSSNQMRSYIYWESQSLNYRMSVYSGSIAFAKDVFTIHNDGFTLTRWQSGSEGYDVEWIAVE